MLNVLGYRQGIGNEYKSQFDVYIGRGSKWGNPFVIGKHGTRAEVIEQFKQHLWHQIKSGDVTIAELKELNGKRLGCFCKPLPCHGDVIQSAVQWAMNQ